LVARALHRQGLGLTLAGRREDALRALAGTLPGTNIRRVDFTEAKSGDALEGVRVVVNCAGPSSDGALAVVDAAIRARAHYIDVTGERSFVHRLHGTRDAAAASAGVIVAPGFAGKGALGDWATSLIVERKRHGERGIRPRVSIAYAHTSEGFVRPSAASALSAASEGFLRMRETTSAPLRRAFKFPSPFGHGDALRVPGVEDLSVHRHVDAEHVHTYISIDPGRAFNALWVAAILASVPLMSVLAGAMRSNSGRSALRAGPDPVLGGPPSFAVSVEVSDPLETTSISIVAPDAYTVTSEILALGVERLLDVPAGLAGVLAPAQIVPAEDGLRALEERRALLVLTPRNPQR